jgi:pimeloyl-ACP methyl ester carboxylesterase
MKNRETKLQVVGRTNPMVAQAALLATGFMRSMAIKRYSPKQRQREFQLLEQRPRTHAARSSIFREKGAGSVPTIILGGFVPDATETVEFQRQLLRQHGSIYYLNYPRSGFCEEMFSAQLADLIDDLGRKGQKPLIMSVSFGSGLLVNFLRQAQEATHQRIRGLILASPVICTADLIRPSGEKREGVRLLESNLKKIVSADPNDGVILDKHIERSRRCFQALFTTGAENRMLNIQHLSIRKKIMDVINHTPARGGFERVLALRDFSFPGLRNSVFAGPVLTLLAENEEDTLVPSAPTLETFRNPALFTRLFPACRVKTVRSRNVNDPVAHASLIFHHEAYNPLLDSWYNKLLYPRLTLAV